MAKNEDIARAIAADPYLKARKAPTEAGPMSRFSTS